jgi:hypothetical protein
MPRTKLDPRSHLVLKFLLAVREPDAARYLRPFGFKQAELTEGWELSRAVFRLRCDRKERPYAPIRPDEVELIAADAAMWSWYLEWSGIARAVIPKKGVLRKLGLGLERTHASTKEL